MLPFGVTIPATVPQRSEIPEGLMNYHVYDIILDRVASYYIVRFGTLLNAVLSLECCRGFVSMTKLEINLCSCA
jgi:hypothetical protein